MHELNQHNSSTRLGSLVGTYLSPADLNSLNAGLEDPSLGLEVIGSLDLLLVEASIFQHLTVDGFFPSSLLANVSADLGMSSNVEKVLQFIEVENKHEISQSIWSDAEPVPTLTSTTLIQSSNLSSSGFSITGGAERVRALRFAAGVGASSIAASRILLRSTFMVSPRPSGESGRSRLVKNTRRRGVWSSRNVERLARKREMKRQ